MSVSDDTFENQFLSINSIHSYLSNMLLGEIEIPEYKLEIDQLSLSALLTGQLVPEKVTRYERNFSKLKLPLRYVGLSDRMKSASSLIHDVTIGSNGDTYTLDRGNKQASCCCCCCLRVDLGPYFRLRFQLQILVREER